MAYLPEGMAEDIANADVFQRGENLRDGEYTFLHVGCSYEKTKKGFALIIEHDIVEAKKIMADIEPNPVGSRVKYFMPDYGDAAVMLKPNMKAYACGIAGHDFKTVDKGLIGALIKEIGGPNQIARGMLVKGRTFHTDKKDGDDFLGVNWYPVPGDNVPNAAGVIKRRAELDAKKAAGAPPQAGAAAPATGAPAIPGVPSLPTSAPPSLPTAPADPLQALLTAGWQVHPGDASYLWKDGVVKKKDDLIAGR